MVINLPIAAAGSDLIGLLIFAAIAVGKWLLDKAAETKKDSSTYTHSAASKMPPQLNPSKKPAPDLADEMKRFMQEMKAGSQKKIPTLQSPSRVTVPKIKKASPPQVVVVNKLVRPSLVEMESAESSSNGPQFDPKWLVKSQPDVVVIQRKSFFDRSLLKNPSQVRQSIALMEILGPPRAFIPYKSRI